MGKFMKTLCCMIILGTASAAAACTPELPAGGGKAQTIESKKYTVAFRTQPEKIEIGKHFTVELAVCANAGAAAPESVSVDATMPEHHHGMNYRTTVTGSGGQYRAQGLMFHMPGRWEYVFEVRAKGATERLTSSTTLQ